MSLEATIQRSPHDKENPYTIISRHLIRDSSISPECRWLLIYLLSMQDGWVIKVKQIWDHVKAHMGRAKVYKIIQEAIDLGYIKKEVIRDKNLIKGIKYFVYETPSFSNNFSDIPISGIPNVKIPKTDTFKKELSEDVSKEDIYTEGKPPEPPLSPPKRTKQKKVPEQKTEVAPRVELTPSQVNALKKKLEGSKITPEQVYERLSLWKIGKDIMDGSDFRMILAWVIGACEKDQIDKPSHPSPKAPNQASQAEITAKDRMLGRDIMKRFVNLTRVELMNVGNDCIEFNLGDRGGNVKVRFGCSGFKDMCLKYLRQLNQDTSGL